MQAASLTEYLCRFKLPDPALLHLHEQRYQKWILAGEGSFNLVDRVCAWAWTLQSHTRCSRQALLILLLGMVVSFLHCLTALISSVKLSYNSCPIKAFQNLILISLENRSFRIVKQFVKTVNNRKERQIGLYDYQNLFLSTIYYS